MWSYIGRKKVVETRQIGQSWIRRNWEARPSSGMRTYSNLIRLPDHHHHRGGRGLGRHPHPCLGQRLDLNIKMGERGFSLKVTIKGRFFRCKARIFMGLFLFCSPQKINIALVLNFS